jgi:hypothetical protein
VSLSAEMTTTCKNLIWRLLPRSWSPRIILRDHWTTLANLQLNSHHIIRAGRPHLLCSLERCTFFRSFFVSLDVVHRRNAQVFLVFVFGCCNIMHHHPTTFVCVCFSGTPLQSPSLHNQGLITSYSTTKKGGISLALLTIDTQGKQHVLPSFRTHLLVIELISTTEPPYNAPS